MFVSLCSFVSLAKMGKGKGKGKSSNAMVLPARLAELVEASKPVCKLWNTPRGCRRGAKCPNSHNQGRLQGTAIHLPHVSRSTIDGRDLICLRPPLHAAWTAWFAEPPGSPQVLHDGKMWSSSEDPVPDLITYNLTGMASPDLVACTAAETSGYVNDKGAVWVSCVMCLCR